jgi:transcriptional regulator with PAS, ATPase and Fis domain
VRAESFRQDLYYRIAGARVVMPPLRERLDDLPMLVQHFMALELENKHAPLGRVDIAPEVWDMFRAHRWPGNVRELRNAVQRLVVAPELSLALQESTSVVRPVAASGSHASVEPLRDARRRAAEAFERGYVREVLARTQGNITRAAAIAEVSRQMIQKLMRKYGIQEREPGG